MTRWTTAAELIDQVRRLWDSGRLLAAGLTGDPLFPLHLRLAGPSSGEITERFAAARDWARQLQAGSRETKGYGYTLEWRELRHRVHGANPIPVAAVLPSEADALRLIGKTREAARFAARVVGTEARHPQLRPWLARRPLIALEHVADWERLLAVLDWFRAHPRPDLYLRQVDVPGVHTKFIEAHKRLLAELLDLTLPAAAIDTAATGGRGFEQRYGLRPKPPLVRFRLLDPTLHLHAMSDISVPPAEFAALRLPLRRVFITENEINGLAFPQSPESIVIFGFGYGLEWLSDIPWLDDVAVHYWGDIDTHGFAILARLRTHLCPTPSPCSWTEPPSRPIAPSGAPNRPTRASPAPCRTSATPSSGCSRTCARTTSASACASSRSTWASAG